MFSARFFKTEQKTWPTWRHVRVLIWHGYFSMAEPKFGSHGEPLGLRGSDGASKQVQKTLYMSYITSGFSDFGSKTGPISGKRMHVPLSRGWCTIVNGARLAMFSARFFKAGGKHGQPGAMSRFHFDMGTSATAEPKFAFHGEALRLRGFDAGSRCGKNRYCTSEHLLWNSDI